MPERMDQGPDRRAGDDPFSPLRSIAPTIYGTDATGYAAGRPDYPPRIYEILTKRCGLRRGSHVVEIGAGTGLVTRHLLGVGARVTTVEPDPRMAEYLRTTVGDVEVIFDTFERARLPEDHFDLVVAATSFHWVDQAIGLRKLRQVLRPGGWSALWWTIFNDAESADSFRDVLAERLGEEDPGGQRNVGFQLDSEARCSALRATAGLDEVTAETIRWSKAMNAAQLRNLYGSLINIRRQSPDEQRRVLDVVKAVAEDDFDGVVRRPFVTVLYTGRCPIW